MGSEKKHDPLICFCHLVRKSEILKAIQDKGLSIEAIQGETCASTGCGGCRPDVEAILGEFKQKISGRPKS